LTDHQDEKKVAKKSYWESAAGRLTMIVILLVLLWNTFQVWLISGTLSRVDKYNLGSVEEMGKVVGDVKMFAEDLNEIRRFLLLPERQYGLTGGDGEAGEDAAEQAPTNTVALYAFLDDLKKEQAAEQNRSAAQPVFDALLAREDLSATLAKSALSLGERAGLQVKFLDQEAKQPDGTANDNYGLPLFNLVFSAEENLFRVQSVLGEQKFQDYLSASFADDVLAYLAENAAAARLKKVEEALAAQQAVEDAARQETETLEARKKELRDLVADPALVDTLAALGLTIAAEPRQEINKEIFDVLDGQGKVRFSLALEVSSGMIKVLRDNQEIDLKSFLEEDGSKKKP
jgi:hypothetical protein